MSDNITVVPYVNNKGGIKSEFCNEIENLTIGSHPSQNMWVSVAIIPVIQNTEPDSFSRNFNEAIEWKLNTHLFQKILSVFGNPTFRPFYPPHKSTNWWVHFLETRPQSLANNALSIKWSIECCYIFLPFSLLGKVTAKINRDKTKAIVVIPKWPTQHWYPSLLRKVTRSMTITPSAKKLVQSQDSQKVHLLHRKLHLQVLLID